MNRFVIPLMIVICSPAFARQDNVEVVKILPSKPVQTIEGFGTSGAWWAQSIGNWPNDKRNKILQLLFNRDDGIGLTIYRYNIGAGSGQDIKDPWRSAETFEISQGNYDWTRDGASRRVLHEACQLGAKKVILFANSPPTRMTLSGKAYAYSDTGLSNLRHDMYSQYATYLADTAEYFIKQDIPVYSVSPINEPQWKWDTNKQEGCHYRPKEAARLINLMIREIARRKLDIKVEGPESGSWRRYEVLENNGRKTRLDYLTTLFEDSTIRKNLDSYSLHSYWSTPEDKRTFSEYFYKTYPEKKLHMSEWCEMKRGRDYGMDSALKMANEIMDDLTIGKVSSWQYWIAVSKYNFHDGLIYADDKKQTFQTTKRLWAMGNFSKFIRPGFTQVETVYNIQGVKLLAGLSSDKNMLALVVINNNKRPVDLKIELHGELKFKEFVTAETSKKYNLSISRPQPLKDSYTFPPESITTVQLTKKANIPDSFR